MRWGLAITFALVACSSARADATSPVDAGSRGDAAEPPEAPTGDLSCVGHVSYPAPTGTTADVDFGTGDFGSGQPLPNAGVKACARADTACSQPLAAGTTGENGRVLLPGLPLGATGFTGFFEVTVPGEAPTLSFVLPPIPHTTAYGRSYFGKATTTFFSNILGVTYDPTRGHLLAEAHDCHELVDGEYCWTKGDCTLLKYPGGIAFEIDIVDPAIVRAYVAPRTISRDATATTDTSGGGGFLNVPPGPVTITARVAQTGQLYARQTVFVRAGAFSAVVMTPTPL